MRAPPTIRPRRARMPLRLGCSSTFNIWTSKRLPISRSARRLVPSSRHHSFGRRYPCFATASSSIAPEQRLCAAACGRASMPPLSIGLYRDLAVSVDRGGAEAWTYQDCYALGASVGAPPDDFNLFGQDWGIAPWIPARLADVAYEPFIAILRANMRHAGALRIDHVMGLRRLFWIPVGGVPADGGYVGYPLHALLGIVALESHRNRCLIIGE